MWYTASGVCLKQASILTSTTTPTQAQHPAPRAPPLEPIRFAEAYFNSNMNSSTSGYTSNNDMYPPSRMDDFVAIQTATAVTMTRVRAREVWISPPYQPPSPASDSHYSWSEATQSRHGMRDSKTRRNTAEEVAGTGDGLVKNVGRKVGAWFRRLIGRE
ncbi:hypothetical protein NA57DRAFT_53066 [Rhizodiscina lignyota]|uniref:Uncharacterized protein n=1 Tax=Rhizodiscina lignyota TaxID=1504668 RepID=A0A9P4IPZ1_9PEZI|nr:hypothetical protein NA57DRAFT_53066 [Rhizodiscina lignyota]